MAIKKKVTYSVSYIAGTDTLSTKLNSILGDIVGLILSHNSGLSVLDTITYGSERMTGAPLYNTRPSNLYSNLFNNRFFESDVVFIGTNENNICFSICFFQGMLVIAMNLTPKVEKSITDVWSSRYSQTTLAMYACGKAARWYADNDYNNYNYSIPYRIVNNTISMSVLHWNSEYSSGYSFINGGGESDGTDLVIFKTNEGNNTTSLGGAIWRWGSSDINAYQYKHRPDLLAWSFNENLLDNPPEVFNYNTNNPAANNIAVTVNGRYDIRQWFSPNNNSTGVVQFSFFNMWHLLGGSTSLQMGSYNSDFSPSATPSLIWNVLQNFSNNQSTKIPSGEQPGITPLGLPYNLPHLQTGQAYVRKMRIPGWNPECKGEIYLLWTPSLTAFNSGDIVEIGNKQYAIITEGVVCWAARVS